MRVSRAVIMAVLLGGTAPLAAETVAITAARMVDVEAGKIVANPVVIAVDGRITAVGSAGNIAIPVEARRIDLAGMTILPGLIDMHVHLTATRRSAVIAGWNMSRVSIPFWACAMLR